MNRWKLATVVAASGLAVSLATQLAVAAGDRHPNLTAAQADLANATSHIGTAQTANEFDMGGHAANAKSLIAQASEQIRLAREDANKNGK